MQHRARAVVLIACVLLVLRPATLWADDTAAAAESLFRAGKALMDEGNYGEACLRFKESHNADPSVGALLNLALCNEKQGKMASAWAYYGEAAVLAGKLRDPERQAGAEKLAAELEPRVSKLAVHVTRHHDGLQVTRNGTAVPSFGAPLPVDPGRYEIVAMAPGHARWTTRVEVAPEGAVASVTVPELEPETAAAPVEEGSDVPWHTIAGWSLVGVGVVGITVGVIFGAVATSNAGQLERDCPDQRCPPGAPTDLLSTTKTQATVSTVGIAVGAAAAAGGVVLLLLAPGGPFGGDVAIAPHGDAGAQLSLRF